MVYNMIKEIKAEMQFFDLTEADVKFVTDGIRKMSWDEFKAVAGDFEYERENEINSDLKVVFKNWILIREEAYDMGPDRWKIMERLNEDALVNNIVKFKA